jgi:Cu/Ag efflux protein CusF
MKRNLILALFAAASLLPFASMAAGHDHGSHAMESDSAAPSEAQMMPAAVKKVDKAKGKITLSHDALSNGMPAMTMAFPVKNKAWLNQVKAGDSVLFRSENINGVMTIVDLKPAGK